jgi:hypothetical protein
MGMFDYVRFGTDIFEEDVIDFNGKKIGLLGGEYIIFGNESFYGGNSWQTKIRDSDCSCDLLEIKNDDEGYTRIYLYDWDRDKQQWVNPEIQFITESGQIYSYFDDYSNSIYVNICTLNSYVFYIYGNIHVAKEKDDELEYEYIPIKFKELKIPEEYKNKLKNWD